MDRLVGWSPGYLATQKPGNLAAAAHLSSAQPSAAHSSAQRSPAQLIAQLSSIQLSSAQLNSAQFSSVQLSPAQLTVSSAQLGFCFGGGWPSHAARSVGVALVLRIACEFHWL